MKKEFYLTILIIALIGVVLLLSLFERPKIDTETSLVPTNTNKVVCVSNESYTAITQDNNGEVGSSILIKTKKNPGETITCAYTVAAEDFELKDRDAEYFKSFAGNYLVTDTGTGPTVRGLTIYSIPEKTKIYEDGYLGWDISTTTNSVSYWSASSPTAPKPTDQNCEDFTKNSEDGLVAHMAESVTLDLSTLKVTHTAKHKCIFTN